MLHIKFDEDCPTGLRDIQVQKCKIFVIQGQVISVSSPIWPKIKLVQAFMPVLVTGNFDDDSIKNARSLMLLYICVKFHENISNGFWVTERTQFCDR